MDIISDKMHHRCILNGILYIFGWILDEFWMESYISDEILWILWVLIGILRISDKSSMNFEWNLIHFGWNLIHFGWNLMDFGWNLMDSRWILDGILYF